MPDVVSLNEVMISELPAATEAHATDQLETNQTGVSRRITLDQVSTVVAASDQIGEVIDTAIGAIPPPPPNDWDSITGKPTTFPPAPHTHPESDITNLVGDLALKAPLASPTFTGDPKAPTPATSDNDTSLATTAYVRSAISTFSPAPDLSGYAPLASPTFTGDPKAPTPTTADNDTSIATTAYVKAQGYTSNVGTLTGVTGGTGVTVSGSAPSPTVGLSNQITAGGPIGNATTVPVITYNAQGQLTAVTTAAISSGASVSVGVVPPGSPSANQMWWNSETGVLYLYYNDGNTSQWVPAIPANSMQSGALTLYSEQVLTVAGPTMTVAFPLGAKRVELDFQYITTPFANPATTSLQGMNGGSVVSAATYRGGDFVITSANTFSGGFSSGLAAFNLGGLAQTHGKATFVVPDTGIGWIDMHGVNASSGARYRYLSTYEGLFSAGAFTGYRITLSGNMAAGSFLRCYAVT